MDLIPEIGRRQMFSFGLVPALARAPEAASTSVPSVVADPVKYPSIDPTGKSNSQPALQKALDDTPSGDTLLIPPGTYLIDGMLSNRGREINIEGYGATLVKTRDVNLLSLYRPLDRTFGVVSLATTRFSDAEGNQFDGLTIRLDAAATWNVGDVVKLIADDELSGVRPGPTTAEASRSGQFFIVHAQSGSDATLRGSLRSSFTRNVRIARLAQGRVSIRGLSLLTSSSGLTGSWKSGLCYMTNIRMPLIQDVTIGSSPTAAINMKSCFAYTIQNTKILFAKDSVAAGQFGYGVIDNSSAYGNISELHASSVRHAYTDDTPRILAGSTDVGAYGRTHGTRVSDSYCVGASVAAFDTHHAAEFVTFSNCTAEDSAAGFSLRGTRHILQDCTALNTTVAFRITSEMTGGESWGHHISGGRADGAREAVVHSYVNHPGHPQGGQLELRPNYINDLIATNCPADIIYCRNTNLQISNLSATVAGSVADGGRLMHTTNGKVDLSNATIDFSLNTSGTNIDVWTVAGTPSTQVKASNMSVTFSETQASRIRHFLVLSNEASIYFRSTYFTAKLLKPWNRLSDGSFLNWELTDRSATSNAITALAWGIEEVGLAQQIGRTSEPAIIVFCDPGAVDRTLVALLPAWFAGQTLTCINTSTTRLVRVRHGAAYNTSLVGAADRTLQPGQSIRLVATPSRLWQEA